MDRTLRIVDIPKAEMACIEYNAFRQDNAQSSQAANVGPKQYPVTLRTCTSHACRLQLCAQCITSGSPLD
eukprot:8541489-Lingulodinium_polyedra.AAC.1